MAESVLCVNWKDHTSELATVYKSLLENNFLVDCTLCAEGQSLKAHRLVLSACSPYFHKLFHEEETVKHPFVVFLEASFETLKAVIDFVYRGETHIPERNLKAFLTLAHSLHIKGLNAFTQDYKNKISSNNPLENGPQGPSQDQFSEGESRSAAHDNPDNCQPDSHHVVGYPDAAHTDSSVPFEEHSPSYEEELFPREYQTPSGCDEVSIDTEITVKQEPLNSVCSERRNEKLDNVKSQKPISRNVAREINGGTISTYGEQDLNQYLSCGAPSLPPPQQQLVQLSVSEGVTEPSLPVIFVPKSEHMEDQESEEPMDDPFVSMMDKNATEQTPAQRFKTVPLSVERSFKKRARGSGIGPSESGSAERRRVSEDPAGKKRKVHTDQNKQSAEADYSKMLKGPVLVNQLVPSSSSSQVSTPHPIQPNSFISPRTSKRKKKPFSPSHINYDPTSDQNPSPAPNVLNAESPESPRQESGAPVVQLNGQSALPPDIAVQILEEFRNIRQDLKSLKDRVQIYEGNLPAQPSESSVVNSLEGSSPNKVILEGGVLISPSALHTISTTGDRNEFITALLLGVFEEEEAKLYRLFPRDASNKAFPQNFIEVAKSQYARFLERLGHKPPYAKGVLSKVLSLLSRKATDLGGRRNTGRGRRRPAPLPASHYIVDPATGELSKDGEEVLLEIFTDPRAADEVGNSDEEFSKEIVITDDES